MKYLATCFWKMNKTHSAVISECHVWVLGGASLVAQTVKKNPPSVQESWVPSLGWKIPWRKAWQLIPVFLPGEFQTEEPGGLQSMGSRRVGHNWATKRIARNLRLRNVDCCCVVFYYVIYFFILGCAASSLLNELSSGCGEQGLLSSWRALSSHCSSFSCCGAQAPGWAGFDSCGVLVPRL